MVGVPIGTKEFIDGAVTEILDQCASEFHKLHSFPFANCFLILLRYCCNQKLMYLLRNVSPVIMMQHAQKFDHMIDNMISTYFGFSLASTASLENIVPGSRLDSQQLIQLARFQIRDSEQRGGIGLSAMASITVPAFHAATSCHMLSTVPLLQQQPLLTRNGSSALFTTPILYSHAKLVELGATVLQADPQSSQNDSTDLAIPHIDLFFDMNAAIHFPRISNTVRQGINQKRLTQWVKKHSPILKHVQNVIQADDSL